MLNKRNSVLIIILVGLINFFQVYDFDFIIDDKLYITENTVVNGGLSELSNVFTKSSGYGHELFKDYSGAYRPVTLFSFLMDKVLFNLNPIILHLENLLFFVLSCLLIYHLLNLLTLKNSYWNLIITLLFLVHPIHQEVISNIKCRDEIFVLLFFLISLIGLVNYQKTSKISYLLFSIIAFTIALFSKESAITFILIYPLFLLFILKQSNIKKTILTTTFYLIPIVIYLFIRNLVLVSEITEVITIDSNALIGLDSFIERKLGALYLVGVYAFKLFIPNPLLWDYSEGYFEFGAKSFLIGFLVVAFFITVIYKAFTQKKLILLFSVGLFIITLSVVSNLIIEIPSTFADRFLTVPSLAIVFLPLSLNFKAKTENQLKLLPLFIIGVFTFLNLFTLSAWKNELSLFEKNPNSIKSYRGYIGYSTALLDNNKQIDKIPNILKEAEKIKPLEGSGKLIFGKYYIQKQEYGKALFYIDEADRLMGNNPQIAKLKADLTNYILQNPSSDVNKELTSISNFINQKNFTGALLEIDRQLATKWFNFFSFF